MRLEEFIALVPGLVLVFCRMAGVFILAPVLGGGQVPPTVRIGAALAIGALVVPFVQYDPAAVPTGLWPYTVAVARETTVGMVLGFGATLLFMALQIAGEVIDIQMGFMMANVTDPSTNIASPLMGQFMYILALLVFLAVNGHHWLIRAMAESYRLIPLAETTARPAFAEHMNTMMSETFTRALQFGAPIVAALLLTEMAMGVVGRAVPQMNIMMLGFSIRIAIGLAVLWFAMASIMDVLTFAVDRNGLYADLIRLVRGMSPGP